jgi:hypothetical protein
MSSVLSRPTDPLLLAACARNSRLSFSARQRRGGATWAAWGHWTSWRPVPATMKADSFSLILTAARSAAPLLRRLLARGVASHNCDGIGLVTRGRRSQRQLPAAVLL